MPKSSELIEQGRDPRTLWRVTIRQLEVPFEKTKEFCWHIAAKRYSSPSEIVALARNRFTPKWWETHIITDIVEIGELHIIDGENLYEPAE